MAEKPKNQEKKSKLEQLTEIGSRKITAGNLFPSVIGGSFDALKILFSKNDKVPQTPNNNVNTQQTNDEKNPNLTIEKVETPDSIRARELYKDFTDILKNKIYSNDPVAFMKEFTRCAGAIGVAELTGKDLTMTLHEFGIKKPGEIRSLNEYQISPLLASLIKHLKYTESNYNSSNGDKVRTGLNNLRKALGNSEQDSNVDKDMVKFQIPKLTWTKQNTFELKKQNVIFASDAIESVRIGFAIDSGSKNPDYQDRDYAKELADEESIYLKKGLTKFEAEFSKLKKPLQSSKWNISTNTAMSYLTGIISVQSTHPIPPTIDFSASNLIKIALPGINITDDNLRNIYLLNPQLKSLDVLLRTHSRDIQELGKTNKTQEISRMVDFTTKNLEAVRETVETIKGVVSINNSFDTAKTNSGHASQIITDFFGGQYIFNTGIKELLNKRLSNFIALHPKKDISLANEIYISLKKDGTSAFHDEKNKKSGSKQSNGNSSEGNKVSISEFPVNAR